MTRIAVDFTFHSALERHLFSNVRLSGSWDAAGRFSDRWMQVPMAASNDGTACEAFSASVLFDAGEAGRTFQWGVVADIQGSADAWVVTTEVPDELSSQCVRRFDLASSDTRQDYWFATGR